MKRIVMIHTVAPLIESFTQLSREILPEVKIFHVLDEPMLEQARSRGAEAFAPGAEGQRRLEEHFAAAAEIGAEAVLVTCSTISPYVTDRHAGLPVVRIDDAMMARAVESGGPIAALATNPATLEPTRAALERRARQAGKVLQIRAVLVEDAFQAFLDGDFARHDRLVQDALRRESKTAGCVVLAQASMARVIEGLDPGEIPVPVLTSPRAALQALKQLLEGQGAPGA